MKASGLFAALAGLAMLAGCGDAEDKAAITADESNRLNATSEMLDASPDSLIAVDEGGNVIADESAESGDVAVADNATDNAQ